eukprot:262081-Prorocentrum_lima.AAC.1
MTSSLVGSEMCIRDRPNESPRRRLRPVEARSSSGGRDQRRPRVVGSSAVSYTHLTLPTICSV